MVQPTKKATVKGRNFVPTTTVAPQAKNFLGVNSAKPKDKKRGGSRQNELSPAGVKEKKSELIMSNPKAPSTAGFA
jgi:hypothetical protein